MIITLSRQMGSYGDEIASQVASELGLLLADRDLIRTAALAVGVAPELLNRLMYEDQRSLTTEMLESLSSAPRQISGLGAVAPSPLGAIFAPILLPASVGLEEGVKAIGAMLRAVADRGNVLFLGQGSQVWLRDHPAALHVQVVAPLEQRAAMIAEQAKVSRSVALRRVRACDSARADYLARYHEANWLDPLLYHLVINTGQMPITDAVATLVHAAQRVADS
jgi:cytidylate kinase